jgi:WD40 repeat protein
MSSSWDIPMQLIYAACVAVSIWFGPLASTLFVQVEAPTGPMNWKAKDDIPLAEPQGNMTSVVFTPNSKKLISARAKTVRVFDLKTARTETSFEPAAGPIVSIAISPNGRILAIAVAGQKEILLWDLADKKEAARLPGHAVSTSGVAFSPDGKVLISFGTEKSRPERVFKFDDYGIRLWNVDKRTELDGFAGGLEAKSAAAISPDGKTLAVGDFLGKIAVIEIASRNALRTFADEGARAVPGIIALAYSPDGKLLASGNGQTVTLCDPETGKNIKKLVRTKQDFGQNTTNLGFSQKGDIVGTGSLDTGIVGTGSLDTGSVAFWNTDSGKEVANLKTERGDTVVFAISPDGRWVASAGWLPRIKLWELRPDAGK